MPLGLAHLAREGHRVLGRRQARDALAAERLEVVDLALASARAATPPRSARRTPRGRAPRRSTKMSRSFRHSPTGGMAWRMKIA